MSPGAWAESQKRRKEIRAQSDQIADLLEKAGIEARQDTGMTMLSAVTNVKNDVLAFRPTRMIPEVAVRERRGMLNALTYYLDDIYDRPDLVRYGVITAGDLVPAHGDLRHSIQDLQRKISKWGKECEDRWNVEVLFRSTEFTRATAAKRNRKSGLMSSTATSTPGLVLYHPHANVLYRPHVKMSPERWSQFLTWTADFFGSHWKDCGRIEDLREIVKYVCKPDDLLSGDAPIDPEETAWLYKELFKLRQTAPMRSFKEWWKELQKDGCKVVTRKAGTISELTIVEKSKRLNHSAKSEEASTNDTGKAENILLGITLPQRHASPWAEPILLIQNYKRLPSNQLSADRLQEIRHEQSYWKEQWNKSGAPAPETALLIAREWEEAGQETNVVLFTPEALEDRTEALLAADAERRAYKVHTSGVTVRDHRSSTRGIPPDPPPEKVPVIHLGEGDDIIKAVEEALGIKKSDANARVAPVIDIWG